MFRFFCSSANKLHFWQPETSPSCSGTHCHFANKDERKQNAHFHHKTLTDRRTCVWELPGGRTIKGSSASPTFGGFFAIRDPFSTSYHVRVIVVGFFFRFFEFSIRLRPLMSEIAPNVRKDCAASTWYESRVRVGFRCKIRVLSDWNLFRRHV